MICYHDGMTRVQIQFTEDQRQSLSRLAKETNRSVAELVREAVDEYVKTGRGRTRADLIQRALDVVGRFEGNQAPVSENHDAAWAESILGE